MIQRGYKREKTFIVQHIGRSDTQDESDGFRMNLDGAALVLLSIVVSLNIVVRAASRLKITVTE
jgi:hypothetical protein